MTAANGNPDAIQAFTRRFGARPDRVASAPGRINWIGEHVDYNDGLVLPMAIDRRVTVAAGCVPGTTIEVQSSTEPDSATIDLNEPPSPGLPAWANYVRGVIAGFRRRGVGLPGMRMLISSELPAGAGLSSSAALTVSVATLLEAAAGHRLSPIDKALVCREAERDFAGVPCGVMDQIASVLGRRGHAILLDCRTLAVEWLPVPPGASLQVFDTTVRHNLASGEYRERRETCEAAAQMLGISSLRDLKEDDLPAAQRILPDTMFRRVRHVVTEIARTREAAHRLRSGDLPALGELLRQSHASLRDDYEVSCPELDAVVDIAGRQPSVHGCRMTGGGFGGSAIVLLDSDGAQDVMQRIADEWQSRTGLRPHLRPVTPAEGARIETAA